MEKFHLHFWQQSGKTLDARDESASSKERSRPAATTRSALQLGSKGISTNRVSTVSCTIPSWSPHTETYIWGQ